MKRWGIGPAVLLIVLVGIVIALLHWMNTSDDGVVHTSQPAATGVPATSATPVDIKTSYFSTLLPAAFTIKRQVETPDADLTLLQLVADGGTDDQQQFAATVGTLPSDGLRSIGDYNLRITDETTYTPFTPPNLPGGAVAFRAASGPATFTVFWAHGTHYIELAFSGGGGATYDQLLPTYAQVITGWNWQ